MPSRSPSVNRFRPPGPPPRPPTRPPVTIAEARRRVLAMLPPGARVHFDRRLSYDDARDGFKPFGRWSVGVWFPGMRYRREFNAFYPNLSLATTVAAVEPQVRRYVRYRERRARRAAKSHLVTIGGVSYHVWRSPLIEVYNGKLIPALIDHHRRAIVVSAAVPLPEVPGVVARCVAQAANEMPWEGGDQ